MYFLTHTRTLKTMHDHQNPNSNKANAGLPDKFMTDPTKPALASIPDACKYMGGISRAKFLCGPIATS